MRMPVHVQMMARISLLSTVSTISDGNTGNQGMHDLYVKIKGDEPPRPSNGGERDGRWWSDAMEPFGDRRFPDEHFGATILLYLLVSGIVSIPYMKWAQRRLKQA